MIEFAAGFVLAWLLRNPSAPIWPAPVRGYRGGTGPQPDWVPHGGSAIMCGNRQPDPAAPISPAPAKSRR